MVGQETKVFVGLWVNSSTRKKFKLKCVELDINQGDVMDILLTKWLDKKDKENEEKTS